MSLPLPLVQLPLQLDGHEISWPFVAVLPKVFIRSPAEKKICQRELGDVPDSELVESQACVICVSTGALH